MTGPSWERWKPHLYFSLLDKQPMASVSGAGPFLATPLTAGCRNIQQWRLMWTLIVLLSTWILHYYNTHWSLLPGHHSEKSLTSPSSTVRLSSQLSATPHGLRCCWWWMTGSVVLWLVTGSVDWWESQPDVLVPVWVLPSDWLVVRGWQEGGGSLSPASSITTTWREDREPTSF